MPGYRKYSKTIRIECGRKTNQISIEAVCFLLSFRYSGKMSETYLFHIWAVAQDFPDSGGCSRCPISGPLGECWGHRGAILGPPNAVLRAMFGPPWGLLGPSRDLLGNLGVVLGPLAGLLGPCWDHVGTILGPLSSSGGLVGPLGASSRPGGMREAIK